MANQYRSVWEVRFLRIKEKVINDRHNLLLKIGNKAVEENLDDDILYDTQLELKILNKIEKEIKAVEDKSASNIFLMRDF